MEDCPGKFADTDERLKRHFSTTHQDVLDSRKVTLTQCVSDCRKLNIANVPKAKDPTTTPPQGVVANVYASQDLASTATPRSRAAPKNTLRDPAFGRGPQTSLRGLYDPNKPSKETTPVKTRQSPRVKKQEPPSQATPSEEDPSDDEHQPISQEQLVAEIKGIYAGLAMVERKCIELDLAQSSKNGGKYNKEWQAIIDLNKALLHKRHDLFASQHLSSHPALRLLIPEYATRSEMFYHMVRSTLERIRNRLPATLELILLPTHQACSMLSLLYETDPAVQYLWTECLHILRCYEIAETPPAVRSRHHYLLMLTQPNALQQLCHYSKSLCIPTLLTAACDSLKGLFDPILNINNCKREEWTPVSWHRYKIASYNQPTPGKDRRRSFLPVLVDGKTIMALPDTQASRNVITEDYAASLRAIIDRDPDKQCTFIDAVGGQIHSSGTVQLDIALLDAPMKLINVTFSVVKRCLEPLVLGSSFLEEHRIFTKNGYSHNLVKLSSGLTHSNGNKMFRLMHMGDLEKKLVCSIDSRPALAKADSGSDINLFSKDYALSRGFIIERFNRGETSYVKLADGTQKHLAGYVEASLSVNGSETPHRFYVLKGLVCDVLLGDDTLEALDVFRKCPDAFVSQGNQKESFCAIKWEERSKEVENSVEATLQSLDHGEVLSQRLGRWSRLRSAFSNRPDEHRRSDSKETVRQLRERLHEINIIESGWRDEPQQKQDLYKARKKIHDELRGRILKHINDLSTLKRTPSGLCTSTSTTTNPSTRT